MCYRCHYWVPVDIKRSGQCQITVLFPISLDISTYTLRCLIGQTVAIDVTVICYKGDGVYDSFIWLLQVLYLFLRLYNV
jgi:hypothetical protein